MGTKLRAAWDSRTLAAVFGTGKAAYDKDHEMADADSPIRPFPIS